MSHVLLEAWYPLFCNFVNNALLLRISCIKTKLVLIKCWTLNRKKHYFENSACEWHRILCNLANTIPHSNFAKSCPKCDDLNNACHYLKYVKMCALSKWGSCDLWTWSHFKQTNMTDTCLLNYSPIETRMPTIEMWCLPI